jgi:glutaminase
VTVDGKVITAGDVKTEVSIQSISKVFTMAQVIQEQGVESIEKRIGVDATARASIRSSPSKVCAPWSAPARRR